MIPTWPLPIPDAENVHLTLGTLDLWLHRGPREVTIGWERSGDEERAFSLDREAPLSDRANELRIPEPGPLTLVPRTPPLSVVARPETPVWLAPGASLRAYVGVPLWLQLGMEGGEGPELPCQPLKHAWAGTTTEGTLCLATRTHLRLALESVKRRPHRILAAVTLDNATDEPVQLERLILPLPGTRLYADSTGLWAEAVRLVHRSDETETQTSGAPKEAIRAVEVAPARDPASKGIAGIVSAVLGGMV